MNIELHGRRSVPERSALYGEPPPILATPNEFDPVDLVRILRRRFWLIVLVSALVFAASLPVILAIEPLHRAETRVLIEPALAVSLNGEAERRRPELNVITETERLAARSVGEAVITALGLEALPEFNPALRPEAPLAALKRRIRALIDGPAEAEAPRSPMERVFPEYAAALSVEREPLSNVITIGFASKDPEIAAAAPGAVLAAYSAEREADLRARTEQTARWLDARIAEQRARLRAAEVAAVEAADAASARPAGRAGVAAELSSVVEEQRGVARARAELSAPTESPDLTEARGELARLDRERARLLEVYGPRYPAVAAVDAALAEARAAIAFEIERARRARADRLGLLDARDEIAAAERSRLERALAAEVAAEAERSALAETAAAERDALEALELRRRAFEGARALPASTIEVLSPATEPLSPSGRGRLFYAAVALIGAGALGAIAAGLAEATDRSVRSLQQLRGAPGLAPAAMIPALPRRVARDLPARLDPQGEGPFQQAVRSLALCLEQANDGLAPRSLMVTSPAPGEGKTLISAALALEFSQGRGRRVLLIDADCRNPRVHALFRAGPGPDLPDVLAGRCAFDEAIRKTAHDGLDLLPCGSRATTRDHDFARLALAPAEEAYDVVIVDGPPALASGRALSLARDVDRVALLALWGRTRLSSVELAAGMLRVATRRDLLFAVNGVRPGRHVLYGYRDADLFTPALRRYQREGRT